MTVIKGPIAEWVAEQEQTPGPEIAGQKVIVNPRNICPATEEQYFGA